MPPVTLKEKAYEQLRAFLLEGTISSNEQLTEKYLVDLLQMSRTPIRAALEKLAAEGLLNLSPNKGLSLPELSLQRVGDFFDFRIALESHIVFKLSNRKLSPGEVAWFRENLELQRQMAEQHDYLAFTHADSDFHRRLAQVYDNGEMVQMMENLQDRLFQLALKVLRKDNDRIIASYRDHLEIFELILAGNGEEAKRRMVEHLEYGARILVL
ncbi:GntR family transcriptional regulator [Paenibacillus sacheonensis]|uniref:FCD domain-containing protein n=1 Tax=Paenibacillus sacheonensis TaxID=742054 RepID=A0A7X5BYS3_9BACL|nr:GntR family transcriptional regulator [Paenibacillus sacheonensis]MBM7564206.1 DNA-binding GntR family transcriptional regulator [Paenibacillus sacheonensis]NBC67470.1 FCD domain-containing protein [Paenibacillus sacheonensis]